MIRKLIKYRFYTDFDDTLFNGTIQHKVNLYPPAIKDRALELIRQNKDFQALQLFYDHLFQNKLTLQNLNPLFDSFSFNEGALDLVQYLNKNKVPVSILSGSDVPLIQHFLRRTGTSSLFNKIIANRSKIDQQGRRVNNFYHGKRVCDCPFCSIQICKGTALTQNESDMHTLFYMGDGMNDFCPTSKLKQGSVSFLRKGYAVQDLMQRKQPAVKEKVKCQVHYYSSLQQVKDFLKSYE